MSTKTGGGTSTGVPDSRVVEFLKTQHAVKIWIEGALKVKLADEDLHVSLKNGVILCYLVQELDQGLIPHIQENTSQVFKLKENIENFLAAVREYGVPRHRLFQVADLYDNLNIVKVVECLAALASIAEQKHALKITFTAPTFTPSLPVGEQLKKLKSMLASIKEAPKGNKGGKMSADILRRKLALLSGKGVELSTYDKKFTRFQALWRGWKARQNYKTWRRHASFRDKVAHEIQSTEQAYVQSLTACIKHYLIPLEDSIKANKGKGLYGITSEQIRTIFSDIKVILEFNSQLLADINTRVNSWRPNQQLGDIFLRVAGVLKIYSGYVQNFNAAVSTLDELMKKEKFANFLNEAKKNPELKGLDLPSFLIMPVQRIPRYNLLLQELLKHSGWPGHPDRKNLEDAIGKVKDVAIYINERKREAENLTKLSEIHSVLVGKYEPLYASNRRFIKEVVFQDAKKGECVIYLFNDLIVWGKPSKKLLGSKDKDKVGYKVKYKGSLLLSEYLPEDRENDGLTISIYKLGLKQAVLQVVARTQDEKHDWLADFMRQYDGVVTARKSKEIALDKSSPSSKPVPSEPTAEELLRSRKNAHRHTISATSPSTLVLDEHASVRSLKELRDMKELIQNQIRDLEGQAQKQHADAQEKAKKKDIKKGSMKMDNATFINHVRCQLEAELQEVNEKIATLEAEEANKVPPTPTPTPAPASISSSPQSSKNNQPEALSMFNKINANRQQRHSMGSPTSSSAQLPVAQSPPTTTLTLAQIHTQKASLDPLKLESYLSNEEFQQVLGSDRSTFYLLPKWRQDQRKKENKLL